MRSIAFKLFIVGLLALLLNGCAALSFKTPEERFAAQVDDFAADLLDQDPDGVDEDAPAAVVPASLVKGAKFTRLEEYAVERLTLALRQDRELYTPTRENWFELREGQPLTFADQSAEKRGKLDRMTIYQVAVTADEVLGKVTLQGTAIDHRSRPIPGVLVESSFPIEDVVGPALLQAKAKPLGSPLPEGMEERPYVSMDRWAYSLASELAEAYRANVVGVPADGEVKVVLQSRALNHAVSETLLRQLESALQQALVAKKGFACAVSQQDFAPVFAQADFYQKNPDKFATEEAQFAPGSVLLLAEAFPHRDGGKLGVNLRALWRTASAQVVPGAAASPGGAYLSGFTARAYLTASGAGGGGVILSPKDKRTFEPVPGRGFE